MVTSEDGSDTGDRREAEHVHHHQTEGDGDGRSESDEPGDDRIADALQTHLAVEGNAVGRGIEVEWCRGHAVVELTVVAGTALERERRLRTQQIAGSHEAADISVTDRPQT